MVYQAVRLPDSNYKWESIGGEKLEQLGAGQPAHSHQVTSRFLYVDSAGAGLGFLTAWWLQRSGKVCMAAQRDGASASRN